MAVVKVIEILAESPDSWEAATQNAINETAKTVHSIKSVYVENLQAMVNDGKIISYRVNVKISFVVDP